MDSAVQVIFLDELFVTVGANFLFDWLLLWATAEVTKSPTSRLRLVAGAALGTVHYALYLLAAYGVIGYYGALRFPFTVAAVSVAMLLVAFAPTAVQRLLRLAGPFYVIFFISAGAGLAVGNLLSYGSRPQAVVSHLAAILALLLTAELGWGVIQQRLWRGLYHIPLEVRFGDRSVRVVALADTGNQLTDPLTSSPVVVVEMDVLLQILPASLRHDVIELSRGDFERVSTLLAHSAWSARLRLIPFSSLGQEHGLLVGFKPDGLRVLAPQAVDIPRQAVVGLARHALDPHGRYQALIHPSLLESVTAAAGPGGTPGPAVRSVTQTVQSEKGGNPVVDTSRS